VAKEWESCLKSQGINDCLWDSFSVQKSADVRAEAERIGLNLYFVAAGLTGRDQPQDFKTNGEMTSRIDSMADELRVTDETFCEDIITAIALELAAWRAITPENVIESWIPMLREPLLSVAAGPDEEKDKLFSGKSSFELGDQHAEPGVSIWLFTIGGLGASLELFVATQSEGEEACEWASACAAPNDGRFAYSMPVATGS
jgi:hypothetical protein